MPKGYRFSSCHSQLLWNWSALPADLKWTSFWICGYPLSTTTLRCRDQRSVRQLTFVMVQETLWSVIPSSPAAGGRHMLPAEKTGRSWVYSIMSFSGRHGIVISPSLSCTVFSDMVYRLLSEWCVAAVSYQSSANHVSPYLLFNLRNLLDLICPWAFTEKVGAECRA